MYTYSSNLMRYNLGCCSNTFLAGLFRRLCTVAVYCDFRARVLLCLLSCTATCALAYCHFCSRVLLFFALVCCYFLLSCAAIFCSRVPLFFGFRVLLCFALVCRSLCATAKSLLDMFFRCVLLSFGFRDCIHPIHQEYQHLYHHNMYQHLYHNHSLLVL